LVRCSSPCGSAAGSVYLLLRDANKLHKLTLQFHSDDFAVVIDGRTVKASNVSLNNNVLTTTLDGIRHRIPAPAADLFHRRQYLVC